MNVGDEGDGWKMVGKCVAKGWCRSCFNLVACNVLNVVLSVQIIIPVMEAASRTKEREHLVDAHPIQRCARAAAMR